jgi:hypothetical protein
VPFGAAQSIAQTPSVTSLLLAASMS